MTNEVADVAVCVPKGVDVLAHGIGFWQELWGKMLAWISEKGVEIAINLIVAIVILVVGIFAIRLIRAAVAKALSSIKKMSKLLSDFIVSVVSKTCWTLLALVVVQRLGINVGPLVAGLGVTGFIVGFAFQETLGSFAAGMMIALNQPFKVGDYVVAGGIEGSVLELNMMATVFATADNKKVIVPNKVVWGSAITNYSALGTRRVDTKINIDYTADIKKAVAVATETIMKLPGVLSDPPPSVAVASLNDSAIQINLRPWATCDDYWDVYSATQEAVKRAFEQNGITIPLPQIDVHMVDSRG